MAQFFGFFTASITLSFASAGLAAKTSKPNPHVIADIRIAFSMNAQHHPSARVLPTPPASPNPIIFPHGKGQKISWNSNAYDRLLTIRDTS